MPCRQDELWRLHPEVERFELPAAKAALGDSERVALLLADLDFIGKWPGGCRRRHPAELDQRRGCRAFPSVEGDKGVLYVLFEERSGRGPNPDTILILLHLVVIPYRSGGGTPPLPDEAWALALSRRTHRSWSPLHLRR